MHVKAAGLFPAMAGNRIGNGRFARQYRCCFLDLFHVANFSVTGYRWHFHWEKERFAGFSSGMLTATEPSIRVVFISGSSG